MTKEQKATKAPNQPHEDLGEGRRHKGKRAQNPLATFGRLMRMVFEFYPGLTIGMIVCIIGASTLSSLPSTYMQRALEVVGQCWQSGDWASAEEPLRQIAMMLIGTYAVALACQTAWNLMGATLTQGVLMKLRDRMFNHMQDLPIRYFDTNAHGDIMSYYTNDVDALRQLIGVALPNLLTMAIAMISTFCVSYRRVLELYTCFCSYCPVPTSRTLPNWPVAESHPPGAWLASDPVPIDVTFSTAA